MTISFSFRYFNCAPLHAALSSQSQFSSFHAFVMIEFDNISTILATFNGLVFSSLGKCKLCVHFFYFFNQTCIVGNFEFVSQIFCVV